MKRLTKLLDRFKGLTNAITRYPLTSAFLLAAATIMTISINTQKDYTKQILACVVGTALCAALQAAYERFFSKWISRLTLMGGGIILTLGYYLIIRSAPEVSMEIGIRTGVALLALIFAFMWVPVIRSRISFNESFMAGFKSFFHSMLYSVVIFGGCSLIIAAMDQLIVNVNEKAYAHTANIVFVLFAPLFFLSLIPVYPGKRNKETNLEKAAAQEKAINKAAFCPKFLEVLISYIIIPLTAVFTAILLLYILLNLRGEFWTNNLLEPMLVSYAVTVILVYILSSRLENKFAVIFRLIFPKVLVPIVLFQITSSILSLRDTGVTHTRYFVILFGIFAASAGVVMSIVPIRKNGIIAAMLIVFSLVSIIPPMDAFTVSRLSQENMLKTVLIRNKMLKNNTITPNGSIPEKDKKKIILSAEYLDRMKYTHKITWLPHDFTVYKDFYDTFGFHQYDMTPNANQSINVFINPTEPINIAGYDTFLHSSISSNETAQSKICDIKKSEKNYVMTKEKVGEQYSIVLMDDNKQEIIRFNTEEVFSRYRKYATDKSEMSMQEAAFSTENDRVKLTFVAQNANIDISLEQTSYYADFYILLRFK